METDKSDLLDTLSMDAARLLVASYQEQIADLQRRLASCYAIAGSEPGTPESDSPRAVESVTELRRDYDEALMEIGALKHLNRDIR